MKTTDQTKRSGVTDAVTHLPKFATVRQGEISAAEISQQWSGAGSAAPGRRTQSERRLIGRWPCVTVAETTLNREWHAHLVFHHGRQKPAPSLQNLEMNVRFTRAHDFGLMKEHVVFDMLARKPQRLGTSPFPQTQFAH